MNYLGRFAVLQPHSLLRQLSNCTDTTCLQGFSNLVTWSIYLEQGTITYATHSVEPFDRLERHLRRLNQVSNETRVQLRMMFEHELSNQFVADDSNLSSQPADYQAIKWLVKEGHLDTAQATLLIQELVKEVIESFLLIKTGSYTLSDPQQTVTKICRLDVEKTLEYCQIRLQSWQSFAPQISSPNQRPYLLINSKLNNKNLPELPPELTHWMKGFSLRHLAVIMNQDEIQLAQNLYPHIVQGGVIMHEPDPPFDQLPNYLPAASPFYRYTTALLNRQLIDTVVEPSNAQTYTDNPAKDFTLVVRSPKISAPSRPNLSELTIPNTTKAAPERVTTTTVNAKKTYKIVSVDDSPTILKEISRFLESENFSVVTIDDPLKAIMSIIRHKPDLILLDLNMAGIDGYELCKIIRNNSMFKNTPIIFVTGNKGIVDKVKARLVGASGYLTKPFTRAELLKLVFMHLA
ncbi:response regulator [Nostoc sp. FACHB-152]|uniref:response regulator n=1 Tax=unclassified Nostoc TaxID=2593658 RepID=UPI001685CF8E|nr:MULTISPECIES: response regulator [unclassified Nostoc]MBD2448977.1 response regulator [Nostoc sp. FACHB-152]MBD2469445.1 response regulator [Nostoc sp. FACHB-145]